MLHAYFVSLLRNSLTRIQQAKAYNTKNLPMAGSVDVLTYILTKDIAPISFAGLKPTDL